MTPARPAKPLRILHIISGDLWAGAENQLRNLVVAQSRRSDAVPEVIILNPGRLYDELVAAGISTILIDEAVLSSSRVLLKLLGIVRRGRPDIIHTHRIKENILGSVAAQVAGRCVCLRTLHGLDEHPATGLQIGRYITKALDRAAARYLQEAVVAVSEDIYGILRKRTPSLRIRLIRNGIDLQAPPYTTWPRTSMQSKTSRHFEIGIVGRLVEVKRVDLFIDAARIFKQEYPEIDASFLIYGDGPLRTRLESLISSYGLETSITLRGHSDRIADAMSRLDMLVMTSDHEGTPMSLLEAMALGVPVVARAVGGIPEILEDGSAGHLVNSADAGDIADAIAELLESGRDSLRLIQRARLAIEARYSADVCAENHQSLYRELLSEKVHRRTATN